MIRSSRKKNPPKRFSPTQPQLYSQENYLLRFEDNDELIVVKRSSIRSIIEDKAIVGTGQKQRFAIIEAKGTYSQCNNMYEQMKLQENTISDQEDGLDEINDFEDNDTISDDNDQNEIPRCRRFSNNFSTMQNDVLINENTNENETVEARVVYQTIDDMHHTILEKLEKKFYIFTKKLNQVIPQAVYQNLDSYREKDEIFPSQVIYEGKDLLEIRGRDIYDFARQTLKILFTRKELSTSILPPARSHLARPALDVERFNLFHGT
ncbi:unnamed protein product [Rotaria sp. Silwood1]|nr:unnamed protein product [Rotaria sp. Silwood1]CAF1663419.1 unnamed protein product [Rotaria sp. Silwood1]CAF4999069.1 unnamed protein product [Rotaria sp. Silwood1]